MPVEFECPHCEQADRADEEEPRACRGSSARSAASRSPTQWAEKPERPGPAARRGRQRALRAGPQLLQQAVERLAVRADEPRRLHAGTRGRRRTGARRPLDSQPPGDGDAAGDRRAGRVPLRRRRPHALRLLPGTSSAASTWRWSRAGCRIRLGARWPSACWPTRSTCCCGCCTR